MTTPTLESRSSRPAYPDPRGSEVRVLTEKRFSASHPWWEQRFREPLLRMRVLGINAVFHDPAAALVVDGEVVAAAEEERFSRRKHGKAPVPFSTWELPEQAVALVPGARPGSTPADLDAVAYSYDPALARPAGADLDRRRVGGPADAVRRAGAAVPRDGAAGLDPARVRFVAHHVAHAASATWPRRTRPRAVIVARRPRRARLAPGRRATRGRRARGARRARSCRTRSGCSTRSSPRTSASAARRDEYKVMAMASYGAPALPRRPARAGARDRRRRLRHRARRLGALRAALAAGRRRLDGRPRRPRRHACSGGSRRCCSTSRAGCTSARASGAWRWPAASR